VVHVVTIIMDMKNARTKRDGAGRYAVQQRCDACSRPIHGDHMTDTDVCGDGDGPGFFLCTRKRCIETNERISAEGGVDALRAHYTAGRSAT
jgi:hypothetical protein